MATTSSRRPRTALLLATVLSGLGLAACGDDTTGSGGSGGAGSAATTSSTGDAATSTTSGDGGAGGGGEGGAGGAAPIDPRFAPLAAAVEAEMEALGAPGAAIAVIEGGEVTFARGFGETAPGSGEPVSASTLFRIGSVTKALTATALLSEVEAGNVGLDDRVVDHVPGFAIADGDAASAILIRHLLTHTTGMSDYLAVDTPPAQHGDDALAALVTSGRLRNNVDPLAPAGAFFNYSNPGYYMAGLTAEVSGGALYRDLVAQRVLAPLGMDRTFFLPSEVLADGDFAVGVTSFPGVPSPVQPDTYENAWARPAGYAFSSALDLARLVTFLLEGDDAVLGAELLDAMKSPQVSTREYADVLSYGYGLFVEEGMFVEDGFMPLPIVSHGGDIPGFAADIMMVPSLDFGLVLLASGDGAHLRESTLVALETLTDMPAVGADPDVAITDEERARFSGTYNDDYTVGPIIVTEAGAGLEIEMPMLDDLDIPYERGLQHLAEETFVLFIQGSYLTISFLPDEGGEVRYARTRAFVGIRPAVEPQGIAAGSAPIAARPPVAARPVSSGERRLRVLSALQAASLEGRPTLLGPSMR